MRVFRTGHPMPLPPPAAARRPPGAAPPPATRRRARPRRPPPPHAAPPPAGPPDGKGRPARKGRVGGGEEEVEELEKRVREDRSEERG
uniref:Uncharacterized protein n=1 Tax=Oryza sativa subsp. japonica TaxID=39947 RepID=Q5Z6T9_ORYSJ|nr:hypothetical protein [Oryza sativa Japonica Group]